MQYSRVTNMDISESSELLCAVNLLQSILYNERSDIKLGFFLYFFRIATCTSPALKFIYSFPYRLHVELRNFISFLIEKPNTRLFESKSAIFYNKSRNSAVA